MPLADRVLRDLEAIFGPRRVSVRGADLDTYSRDMWPRLLLRYRETGPNNGLPRPHAVVWPEHVREVVAVVKLARSLGVPIVPYGGGSGVCGGAVPVHGYASGSEGPAQADALLARDGHAWRPLKQEPVEKK